MNFSKAQTFSEVISKMSGGGKGPSIQAARRQSKLSLPSPDIINEEDIFDEDQNPDEANPE